MPVYNDTFPYGDRLTASVYQKVLLQMLVFVLHQRTDQITKLAVNGRLRIVRLIHCHLLLHHIQFAELYSWETMLRAVPG